MVPFVLEQIQTYNSSLKLTIEKCLSFGSLLYTCDRLTEHEESILSIPNILPFLFYVVPFLSVFLTTYLYISCFHV
jgi:hypothetical protein